MHAVLHFTVIYRPRSTDVMQLCGLQCVDLVRRNAVIFVIISSSGMIRAVNRTTPRWESSWSAENARPTNDRPNSTAGKKRHYSTGQKNRQSRAYNTTSIQYNREDWQSATVVNSTLVVDPTIRLPGFDLHRRQWSVSLLNRFRTGQGHCNACHKKCGFTDTELCDCGEIQTMSHVVNFCSLTKFDGGLLHLHEVDEAAIDWLTTYGS